MRLDKVKTRKIQLPKVKTVSISLSYEKTSPTYKALLRAAQTETDGKKATYIKLAVSEKLSRDGYLTPSSLPKGKLVK